MLLDPRHVVHLEDVCDQAGLHLAVLVLDIETILGAA